MQNLEVKIFCTKIFNGEILVFEQPYMHATIRKIKLILKISKYNLVKILNVRV